MVVLLVILYCTIILDVGCPSLERASHHRTHFIRHDVVYSWLLELHRKLFREVYFRTLIVK